MRRIWIICFLSNVCIDINYFIPEKKQKEGMRERERERENEIENWMIVEVSTLTRSTYHRINVRLCARERRICVFFSVMIVCYFWSNHKQPVELNLKQPLSKNVNFHSNHFVIYVWCVCMNVHTSERRLLKNLQPVGACMWVYVSMSVSGRCSTHRLEYD